MSKPIKIAEAKAQFSKLVARAERGEEIIIARGQEPVARLVPLKRRRRQSGLLRKFMSPEQIAALAEAVEAPLSERDQRSLEGEGTDETGIWIGLSEDRDSE